MPEVQIFISYRRDDSAGYARAIYDELARHWGAERVFIDVDDIGAGQAFADVIGQAVRGSGVLLVLIGQRWLGQRVGQPSRLFEAQDFVRLEVSAALARGTHIIPLLLDGAAMPTAAQLPEPLQALAGRNALELRGTHFAADMAQLVAAIQGTLPANTGQPARRRWQRRGAVIGTAVALVAVATLALRPRARLDINGAWQADVEYDWPSARYVERFEFSGEKGGLQGSASFLGVRRGVLEGGIDGDGLHFITRTAESSDGGENTRELVHRYRGRWVNGEIQFVMQTEGGSSAHVPIKFVARRH